MNYQNEQDELRVLHRLAAEELSSAGENLIVWAGGDAPNQQDALVRRFTQRFPDIPLTLTVNLSKYLDIKVYQGLMGGRLEADVAILQTTNNFEDWKAMGALEPFIPQSFESLIPGYSDDEGAYLAVFMLAFLPQYAKYGVCKAPTEYRDFLMPEYINRLVLTPPHDDDAVLFVYDHILERHGVRFLHRLAEQNPRFIRGTAAPAMLVGQRGFLGNITGIQPLPSQPSLAFIPEDDVFITWPQRAAMFKLTRHKAAARLFLAYLVSHEYQSQRGTWSVRGDVAAPYGFEPLESYSNTDPLEFINWMRDRQHVNQIRNIMADIFGPVSGLSPLIDPALLRLYR